MKILMVCLGNICRSPLAMGVMRKKLVENGLTHIQVDSCGTAGYHIGEAPDQRSIKKGKEYGIDISSHKGQKFNVTHFSNFDLILVMDEDNYNDVVKQAHTDAERNKVKFILNYTYPGKNLPVPDPYYGNERNFEEVYQLLNKACEIIATGLKK